MSLPSSLVHISCLAVTGTSEQIAAPKQDCRHVEMLLKGDSFLLLMFAISLSVGELSLSLSLCLSLLFSITQTSLEVDRFESVVRATTTAGTR